MFPFLKYISRSVHEEYQPPHPEAREIVDGGACTTLTVWRKSLLVSCEGFTVIDWKGDLVYRVDNYARTRPEELLLMDKDGNSVLFMRRLKKFTMVDRWGIYDAKDTEDTNAIKPPKRPIWCVKKNVNAKILGNSSDILAYVYYGPFDKKHAYVIKGSYGCRSCKVVHGSSNRTVSEIKTKQAKPEGVRFGLDVFDLVVYPGFDPGLAMALVLLLDRMFS
ncbi:PREDICTED: protein LURP-one-related 17 [Tarenaya hassleriana]|uniref:protein LURP-one-related 17 n=1 Tax=Tarenaya hassleriana TaxID=28532 RepID=UPI00053C6E68|nr:PREDICTED: protein LURP-one-related 17 [Tarenaya hassleriana]